MARKIPLKQDLAFRALALYYPQASKYIEEADKTRLEYLSRLNGGFLKEEHQIRLVALLDYALFLGMRQIMPPISEEDANDLFELYVRFKHAFWGEFQKQAITQSTD